VVKFIEENDFKFVISYHTHGNLILYPWGWQVQTPSLDDAIFVAQAGTDANPAIWDSLEGQGYNPGVGADLYTTNGDFTDWAYYDLGIPAQTVEFTTSYDFRFPDDEEMVQTVFEDSLDFALSVAESALDPGHPVSPVGIVPQDLYHTPLTVSYGPNQTVVAVARKQLDLKLKFSINGGDAQEAGFSEQLGIVYNDRPGTYYSRYVAVIDGQSAGDNVNYWFEGATTGDLGPFSYSVMSATGNPILVMAAEDYSGWNIHPSYPPGPGPHYLGYYTDALDAGGYAYNVWDLDAHAAAPSYAEVLSHHDAAVWYTGNDYAATVPCCFDIHWEEVLNFREFMNYGGKLFATGQDLARLSVYYGFFPDDYFQYYLGAYMHIEGGGMNPDSGLPYDVMGDPGDPVFDGLDFSIQGGDGAGNQGFADDLVVTSSILPHFDHSVAARYDRPGGAFNPNSGDYYVYSQMADLAFKRLGGTFTLPVGSPTLKLWLSYDIETDWDFAFVEISEAGSDTWTTLSDLNGLTTTNTGQSCAAGWVDRIHPFLAHYMDDACNSSGTTGEWHAFTGNSDGWQQVEMDLSDYAGKTVELYISYVCDWATQGLGAVVDDIELSGYPLEDFEAGMGLWGVSPPPEGSSAFNNWVRITVAGFPVGPAIRTPNSVYLGFGFEAIDTADNRNAVMDRVMKYFGQ
jgi:hypothetical protein